MGANLKKFAQSITCTCTCITVIKIRARVGPGVAPHRPRTSSVNTVSSIPVTGRVVTGCVAIFVMYPVGRTAISTVRDRPAQINLGGGGEEHWNVIKEVRKARGGVCNKRGCVHLYVTF